MSEQSSPTARDSTGTERRWRRILRPIAYYGVLAATLPTSLLTSAACGEHYSTIDAIVCLPTTQQDCKDDMESMLNETKVKCRKVLISSGLVLGICASVYYFEYASQAAVQLFLLTVTLGSIQGIYLSHAVNSFVKALTKRRGRSAIFRWELPEQKIVASRVLAIPDAYLLGHYMLAGFSVLLYLWNPSAAPLLDFLLDSKMHLPETLRQPISTLKTNMSTTDSAWGSGTIVGLAVSAMFQLAIVQCVMCRLQKIEEDDIQGPRRVLSAVSGLQAPQVTNTGDVRQRNTARSVME